MAAVVAFDGPAAAAGAAAAAGGATACTAAAGAGVGLHKLFRQTKRKTEGPQHFAFPEISRENRGCLVLHSGNSRVSLSLRAGLGQNLAALEHQQPRCAMLKLRRPPCFSQLCAAQRASSAAPGGPMACSASREAEAGRVSASRAGGHAPRTRERVARKSASRACFCVTVILFSSFFASLRGLGVQAPQRCGREGGPSPKGPALDLALHGNG